MHQIVKQSIGNCQVKIQRKIKVLCSNLFFPKGICLSEKKKNWDTAFPLEVFEGEETGIKSQGLPKFRTQINYISLLCLKALLKVIWQYIEQHTRKGNEAHRKQGTMSENQPKQQDNRNRSRQISYIGNI